MIYIGYLASFLLLLLIIYLIFDNKNLFKIEEIKKFFLSRKILGVMFILISILIAYSWGTQNIVKYFKYNPRYIGYPIFKNMYNPFLIVKIALVPGVNKNYTLSDIMTKVAMLLNFVAFIILMILLKIEQKRPEDTHGTARWAKEEEYRKFLVPLNKYEDGVILGRTKELTPFSRPKTIIDNEKTHIAVVAPTRSGKGVGIIIPTLLNWLGSCFTLDMKGENHDITAGYRKEVLGQKILKYQPYSFDDSISYNPLAEVRLGTVYEVKDATIIADILTDPGEGKKRDHWDNSASALFVGLILYVLYKAEDEGRTGSFGDIVDFLTDTTIPLDDAWVNLIQLPTTNNEKHKKEWKRYYSKQQLGSVGEGIHPVVARTAAEIMNKDERERASIISSVMAKMTLFKDPIIRKNTTNIDFRIKDLMDYETPVSFYVVVTAEEMETLSPLLRILITQVIGVLAPKMDFNSDAPPHKHRLLLMLDEFPAFGTIPLLEKALAYIAGYGMKAVIIAQALNQIRKNYGDKNSVFDNCATAVFYAPTPLDETTPKQISELLGDTTIKVTNKSWKAFSIGQANLSENNQTRKLLTPEEVRNKLGDKRNLISVSGMYPYMGWKIRFYEEEYFKTKTNKVYGIPSLDKIEYEKEKKEEKKEEIKKTEENEEKDIVVEEIGEVEEDDNEV